MDPAQISVLLRLLIAAVLGGVVGLEREFEEKPAGLRAHTLTAIAAALFVSLGVMAGGGFGDTRPGAPTTADPARTLAGIVVGVSLITAAVIVRGREAWPLRSLTTGATLLVTAAIGSAVGLGQVVIAGGAALLVLVVNLAAGRYERRMPGPREEHSEEVGEEESLTEL